MKLARRVTGRPGDHRVQWRLPRPDLGRAERHDLEHQLPPGTGRCCPSVYISPFPNVYRDFAGDEAAATADALAALRAAVRGGRPAVAGGRRADRAGPGRGWLQPGAAGVPPGPARALRPPRHPAHRRRGPVRLRPDGPDVGLRARRDRPGHRCSSRRRIANGLPLAAIVSSRELQVRWGVGSHGSTFGGNPVACAAGIAVLDTIARVRPRGERGGARRGASRRVASHWQSPMRASATSAARG